MKVRKILNNSVVLAVDERGAEAVLWGAGLGFSLSPGMQVDLSKVERTFVPSDTTSAERLAAFVQEIPIEDIEITEDILRAARTELGGHITDHVLVPLADHVSYALQRAREGLAEIDYPLRWEVQQLYPAEVAFSRRALGMIADRTGIALPAVEAVPMALHFVNAQFSSPDLGITMRMTELLTQALDLIHQRLGFRIDENSVPVARFITHLRYLFLREHGNRMAGGTDLTLYEPVRNALPTEHELALDIARLLGERFDHPVTDEEVLYLTLHVGRLTASARPAGDPGSENTP